MSFQGVSFPLGTFQVIAHLFKNISRCPIYPKCHLKTPLAYSCLHGTSSALSHGPAAFPRLIQVFHKEMGPQRRYLRRSD